MERFKKNRHAYYRLTYHLVVVTKYRHKCITPMMKQRIREITDELFSRWNCECLELNGEEDHIHILFDASPQINLASLVNSYKTVTSRYLRKEFAEHLQNYYWKPYFWSRSYMVLSTGGATIDIMRKYIEGQGKEEAPNPH